MINFEHEISTALKKRSATDFIESKKKLTDGSQKIYVIGKNEQSSEIIRRYNVAGLVDDFSQSSETWYGTPIVRVENIEENSLLINCVTSISPIKVKNRLQSAGLENVLQVSELISEDGDPLSLPWFVAQQRDEMRLYQSWWNDLFARMSDDLSQKVLLDVARFRLTADLNYMNDYDIRLKDQYFEDFMGYRNEIFVDAGGYDGDTTEEFVNRYPDYKKVYLFEPSRKNISAAKRRLYGLRDINFRSVGLSDEQGIIYFNADAGSASAVAKDNGELISMVTLDEELHDEEITFIKMDLEGWEINALRGAEKTIKKSKPKLAIAVYHAAKDFREIPKYVLDVNPEYKIYLRHYTQGWSETVMFFL